MKREIKFRGKRYGDKSWVYGNLYQGKKEGEQYSIILNDAGYHVAPQDDRNFAIAFFENEVNVVFSNTVGQYTGLKDKNGKEIYEGDIIRYTDTDSFVVNPDCDPWLHFRRPYAIVREEVVVFEDGMFCNDEGHSICYLGWESIKDLRECLDIPDGEDCDVEGTIIDESLLGIEVIGNIYDNPELVEQ